MPYLSHSSYHISIRVNSHKLITICPKKWIRHVYFHRDYARSHEEAGWLNVLWIAILSSSIEPSRLFMADGVLYPGLPPHTPNLGPPVMFPPEQRPVSFFIFTLRCKWAPPKPGPVNYCSQIQRLLEHALPFTSFVPLGPKVIAEQTAHHGNQVRLVLRRLVSAREILLPAYDLSTVPGYLYLKPPLSSNKTIPDPHDTPVTLSHLDSNISHTNATLDTLDTVSLPDSNLFDISETVEILGQTPSTTPLILETITKCASILKLIPCVNNSYKKRGTKSFLH